MTNIDKAYSEFLKVIEKELKACDSVVQNALKRASNFVKNFEKELQVR